MRRLWLVGGLAVLLTAGLQAYSYLAFEQITVANTAVGFTAAKITNTGIGPGQATVATCSCRTAEISFTYDGVTTPTASVGMLWEPGETKTFSGHDVLANFRAIRTGASSGQLDCAYSAP